MSDEKDKTKKDSFDGWRLYGNTYCHTDDDGEKHFKFKDRELQKNTIIDKDGASVKTSLYNTAVKLGYIVEEEGNNGR